MNLITGRMDVFQTSQGTLPIATLYQVLLFENSCLLNLFEICVKNQIMGSWSWRELCAGILGAMIPVDNLLFCFSTNKELIQREWVSDNFPLLR